MTTLPLPSKLQVNAFTGGASQPFSDLDEVAVRQWALNPEGERAQQFLAPPPEVDESDWRDPKVGWGLILPDVPGRSAKARAAGEDAPDPIRKLLAERPDAPVFRYRAKSPNGYTHLRRDYPDRPSQDIAVAGGERGVGHGELPRYLLIYATPEQVPWRFQFLLNQSAAVGRLALQGDALERYVDHLVGECDGCAADPGAAVVWSVDQGPSDITHLMRETIAEPVFEEYAGDLDLKDKSRLLAGDQATAAALLEALTGAQPGVVVTTSHGTIGPPEKPEELRQTLGIPVDRDFQTLAIAQLLERWQPDGAIWYTHACCSAGSDHQSAFTDLIPEGSDLWKLLTGVADVGGARIAPLPEALLGASKPARAFIGHVEPTFDWTLRDPQTRQPFTATTREAFYDRLFRHSPIGHALRPTFDLVGQLFGQREAAYRAYNDGEETLPIAFASQLAALDRRSLVIIGDPTVELPR